MKKWKNNSLLVLSDLHEHHPEVGPPQVQGQELADLGAAWQLPDVGGEALDGGGLVGGPAQAAVDGAAQALLHLGDVVVVDHQVAAQVLGAFSGFYLASCFCAQERLHATFYIKSSNIGNQC